MNNVVIPADNAVATNTPPNDKPVISPATIPGLTNKM
jgi:hypothetical protein